jgi:hypothetical protein
VSVTSAGRGEEASISRAEYSIFGADSEVGPDLAAVDWAATPLGSPVKWPQSLRTAVRILLAFHPGATGTTVQLCARIG